MSSLTVKVSFAARYQARIGNYGDAAKRLLCQATIYAYILDLVDTFTVLNNHGIFAGCTNPCRRKSFISNVSELELLHFAYSPNRVIPEMREAAVFGCN